MADYFTISENKKYLVLLLIISFVIGSVSLIYPFGRDQGIYAYCAKLLLEGKINYKYSFDLKPPGIHFIFAIGQFLLGKEFIMMRIIDLFAQTASAIMIYFIIYKRMFNKSLSLAGSVLYVFLYYRLDYWHTLQAESFINLFIIIIIFLLSYKNNYNAVLISGILLSFILLLKHTYILLIPLLLLYLYLYSKDNKLSYKKTYIFFLTGFLSVILITLCYYYLSNALSEFLDIMFRQIPFYAKQGFMTESSDFYINNIIRLFTISVYSPLIWLSVIYFMINIIKKKIKDHDILLLIWLLISIILLISQGRFFPYHFIILIPPLVVSTFLFINQIINIKKKYIYAALSIALLIFILIAGKPYVNNYSNLLKIIINENDLKSTYETIGITSDSVYTIKKIYEVTDRVISLTQKNENIFIWGFEPIIYYLSERDCSTRFTYNIPLIWKDYNNEQRIEFLSVINANKPKLILVTNNDPILNITGTYEDSEKLLDNFPEFKDFITNNYILQDTVENFKFYKLL